MAIKVQIPSPLRPLTGGAQEVEIDAGDVASLIEGLESRHKGLRDRLCDPDGNLRSYVRIFVNDEDVRSLQDKATPLRPGDTVAIVPAIAGGGSATCEPAREGVSLPS
jgi:molybdopterin synthase sulfur carrier subunit